MKKFFDSLLTTLTLCLVLFCGEILFGMELNSVDDGVNLAKEDRMYAMMKFLDSKHDDMIEMLQSWIRQESISIYNPSSKYPYGEGCAKMLDLALKSAHGLGFENVVNYANHLGVVESGSGAPSIGIACHLDTVPIARGKWEHDPFSGDVVDGKVYGLGASDNKCSGVSALYALLAFRKFYPEAHNVRLFLGCCEESGMHDFTYYFENVVKKEDLPPVLVPDAGIVIGYGCGGMVLVDITKDVKTDGDIYVESIVSGGNKSVPGSAEAVIKGVNISDIPTEDINDCPITVSKVDGGVKVYVKGKTVHSSGPKWGKNAAIALLNLLVKLPLSESEKSVYFELLDAYNEMDRRDKDEIGKKMTFVMIGLFLENGKIRVEHNSRSTIVGFIDDLDVVLDEYFAKKGFDLKYIRRNDSYSVDKECDFIKRLEKSHFEFTGEPAQLMHLTGGTYAKCFKFGVSYGQYSALMAHKPDEYIPVDYVLKSAKLLAHTLVKMVAESHETNAK